MLAGWKFALSFRKQDWGPGDYPVQVVRQKTRRLADEPDEAPAVPLYRADVVNWLGVCGTGNTPAEALADLAATLERIRAHRETMPRPGTRVPIKFASQERIAAQAALADDFIHHVLELDWAWISDESSLQEFGNRETQTMYYEKIRARYGVDVSEIASGNLAEILERIAQTRN